METITPYLEALVSPSNLPILIGVTAVFLLVIIVKTLRLIPTTLFAFKNEFGTVLVTRKALSNLVQDACKENESVKCSRVRVLHRNRRLRIILRLRVENPGALSDTVTSIQNGLTTTLRNKLNIENLEAIDVLVTEIHPSFLNLGTLKRPKAEELSRADTKKDPKSIIT